MAAPRGKEPLRFHRASSRRLEEARFLLTEGGYTTAAVYLVSRATTDKVREDVAAREAALARLTQQFADKCLALLAIALL